MKRSRRTVTGIEYKWSSYFLSIHFIISSMKQVKERWKQRTVIEFFVKMSKNPPIPYAYLFQNFECIKIRLENQIWARTCLIDRQIVLDVSTFQHAFPFHLFLIFLTQYTLHSVLPFIFSFSSFYHFDILSSDLIYCASLFTTFLEI